MTKDISDEEFDKMLDQHFSNDSDIKRGIAIKLHNEANSDQIKLRGKLISESKKGVESPFKGKERSFKGKPRINKSVEHHTEESKLKISKTKEEKRILLGITKKVKTKKSRSKSEGTKNKISQSISELHGVKCIVIDPTGIRYEFDTIKECEIKLNYENLTPNARIVFPLDGSSKVGRRGKWKGWTFFRI